MCIFVGNKIKETFYYYYTQYHPTFSAQKIITRDCLSNFRAFRTDIPADTYEGCRAAAKDVNLANYVNNTIKELDIKRYMIFL